MTAITSKAGRAFVPDAQFFDPNQVMPEALILATSTYTVPIDGDAPTVLVPYIDADADAGFTAEGADIDQAAPNTSSVTIYTGKVAVLGKISREAYEADGIAALVSNSFKRAVVKKANTAYLAQAAPTSPATTPPAGLLNLAPTNGGTVAGDLDELVDAVAGIEAATGAATHIIAAPTAWASLRKLKAATGSNVSLIGAGTDDAARSLLSVPVLVSSAMTANTMLVLDKAAVLSTNSKLAVAVSEHAYFGADSIGVRVTWRIGAKIVDTDRVVKLTITDPDAGT